MKTVTQHIRDRLLSRLSPPVPLAELRETEWSQEFERLMRNRLIVGSYRYGRMGSVGKPLYRCIPRIRRYLDDYEETGNLECLVDVANLALVEFVEGSHPRRHFRAVDDGKHTEIYKRW